MLNVECCVLSLDDAEYIIIIIIITTNVVLHPKITTSWTKLGPTWGLEGKACVKPKQKWKYYVLFYEIGCEFTELLLFLKRRAPIMLCKNWLSKFSRNWAVSFKCKNEKVCFGLAHSDRLAEGYNYVLCFFFDSRQAAGRSLTQKLDIHDMLAYRSGRFTM